MSQGRACHAMRSGEPKAPNSRWGRAGQRGCNAVLRMAGTNMKSPRQARAPCWQSAMGTVWRTAGCATEHHVAASIAASAAAHALARGTCINHPHAKDMPRWRTVSRHDHLLTGACSGSRLGFRGLPVHGPKRESRALSLPCRCSTWLGPPACAASEVVDCNCCTH